MREGAKREGKARIGNTQLHVYEESGTAVKTVGEDVAGKSDLR